MSGLLYTGGQQDTGAELAQTMAAIQIRENIDAALAEQSTYWDPLDEHASARLGVLNRVCKLERPPRGCIYSGTRLGILDMPWERFPAVATMVDKATTTAEGRNFDQSTNAYVVPLFVEVIVRSDEYADGDLEERIVQEGIVDKRAKRTIAAVAHCIGLDPTLQSTCLPLESPSFSQTNAFVRKGEDADELTVRRVFCLARAQYSLPSYATRLDASQPAPSVLAAQYLGGLE